MSTDYYAILDACEPCGRYDAVRIAHTAAGWNVTINAYPSRLIGRFDDWACLAKQGKVVYIEDEKWRRLAEDQRERRMR